MEGHAFNRLSPVNGKVFGKHGKQNAGQKNPRDYQKNFDHREMNAHFYDGKMNGLKESFGKTSVMLKR